MDDALASREEILEELRRLRSRVTELEASQKQRRYSDEALRESRRSLVEAQRIAQLGSYDWDIVANELTWSDEQYRIFGLDPSVPTTLEAFYDAIHPDDRPLMIDAVAAAMRGARDIELDFRISLPSGEERSVHGRGEILFDDAGAPFRLIGTSLDITPRKRAEAELAQHREHLEELVAQRAQELHVSEARYRSIFEFAPVSLWESDLSEANRLVGQLSEQGVSDLGAYLEQNPDFIDRVARTVRVLDINEATVQLCGAKSKEELMQSLGRVFNPSIRATFAAQMCALAEGRSHFESETTIQTLDGEQREILLSLTIAKHDSRYEHLLFCLIDLTEHKRAEEGRAAVQERSRHAQRLESLGVLAGGIAHDFNNLLSVILGNSRLTLAGLEANDPLAERVREIRAAAEHAAAITDQILTYSGEGSATKSAVDLSRLVDETMNLLRPTVRERGELEIRLARELPPVLGDATQLRQVILNLVTNAVEALEERGGQVLVSSGTCSADSDELASSAGGGQLEPGPYVYLEVSDTGVGMDEETRRRIFDPYFTTKFAGRGLGLAALLGIVRGHAGDVLIRSQPGEGTTVRVLLPIGEGLVGVDEARDSLPATTRESPDATSCILVIDDEEGVLELTRIFLERSGFRVLTASGGLPGIELFRAKASEVDAIVLDLAMPDLGGEEALGEIRRLRPRVPVVLTSGYSEEIALRRFSSSKPDGFVRKPYEPERLSAILQQLLER